ncbi:MAG: HPr(Ser) kinase/phosphatase [Clostridiales bacterium]|jgi:HPr kinase/phosphorylase|nr:HPr(Ser) kinase/phosphatase [Clostridiales bacterium]
MTNSVALCEIIEEYGLKVLTEDVDIKSKMIYNSEINRPALQLAGFYDYFDEDRIQLVGKVETAYLLKITPRQRRDTLERLFKRKLPAVIICRGIEPFPEMLKNANENGVPVLQSDESTANFMAEIMRWLHDKLAEKIMTHGVLVDIYGEGVLIMGESGIGKSEAALELIQRGHRLVADDSIIIKRVSSETLIGSCPEVIQNFVELRGIGIVDVRQLFGVQSIKATQAIDLVIKLESWDSSKFYDRLGMTEEYAEILGNKIVCNHIPIRPGRNIAIICESAAINNRQKKMGYNAAHVLSARVLENMNKKNND